MANAPDIAVVWVTLDNRCVLSGDGVNYFVTLSQGGKVFDRRPSPTRARRWRLRIRGWKNGSRVYLAAPGRGSAVIDEAMLLFLQNCSTLRDFLGTLPLA
jgi:hypothetical protein